MTNGYQPKGDIHDAGSPPHEGSSGRSPDQELQRLRALVYVPGLWRCAKCSFQLVQANLNAHTGAVTARDEPGDKCPNCQGPLWRVTEREAGNELVDRMEVLERENRALKEADAWRPIDTLPKGDSMVLAGCPPDADFPDGRVMLWRADTLRAALKADTPAHLQFPATHWKPRPAAPGCAR